MANDSSAQAFKGNNILTPDLTATGQQCGGASTSHGSCQILVHERGKQSRAISDSRVPRDHQCLTFGGAGVIGIGEFH